MDCGKDACSGRAGRSSWLAGEQVSQFLSAEAYKSDFRANFKTNRALALGVCQDNPIYGATQRIAEPLPHPLLSLVGLNGHSAAFVWVLFRISQARVSRCCFDLMPSPIFR